MKMFDSNLVVTAIKFLDSLLTGSGKGPYRLVVGGGGALIALHGFQGVTADVDAVMIGGDINEIESEVRQVQAKLNLPADWINPHYSTFTIYLPKDYRSRAENLFVGKTIRADALGAEDLLIMKFMAGRNKDLPHIRFLMRRSPDLEVVENRLLELKMLFPETAQKALQLFDEISAEFE